MTITKSKNVKCRKNKIYVNTMNRLNDYIINYVRQCCLTMFLFLFIFICIQIAFLTKKIWVLLPVKLHYSCIWTSKTFWFLFSLLLCSVKMHFYSPKNPHSVRRGVMIVTMQEDYLKCSALVSLVQHYLNAMVHPTY